MKLITKLYSSIKDGAAPNIGRIQEIAEEYQRKTTAPLGFAFCDMNTGKYCFTHADEAFPIASAFKIFVLAELMRMVENGELSLDDRITLREEDKSEGSGILRNLRPGLAMTVYDYAYLMMSYSDNTATDIILQRITLKRLRENIIRGLGLTELRVDMNCTTLVHEAYALPASNGERLPDGRRSFRNTPYFTCSAERNIQCTPRDMLRGIRMLYQGKIVGPEHTRQALEIMKKCALNQRIPAKLPQDVESAHKTGSIDRVANDVGFVYTKKGVYALALFYNGNCADWNEYCGEHGHAFGNELLASLSRDVYAAYMEN